jgi:hypothetical protein
MGRIRPARLDEDSREDMLRADAVLALTASLPSDLSAFENFVATLIDGVRPVARIKKKANVSSQDLRIALNGLADRNLVRLAGIVEEAIGTLARDIAQMKAAPPEPTAKVIILPLPAELSDPSSLSSSPAVALISAADIAGNHPRADATSNANFLNEPTITDADGPIPLHVMAEIRAMIDEDELAAAGLDDDDGDD